VAGGARSRLRGVHAARQQRAARRPPGISLRVSAGDRTQGL